MFNYEGKENFMKVLGFYSEQPYNINQSVVYELLDKHFKNKSHIYKLFGNRLKIEKEFEFKLSANDIRGIRDKFYDVLFEKFGKKATLVCLFCSNISINSFGENKLDADIQFFDTKFSKGMRLTKCFRKLVSKEIIDDVNTAYSMELQSISTKGKVVASIDPIDYITMSSNNSGWSSCHRINGGEYAAGPLAYLADTSTVICYVESNTKAKVADGGEHSNKRWRQIALVSPLLDFAIQERQYPNKSKGNANAVSGLFVEAFSKFHDEDFAFKKIYIDELQDLHRDYVDETGCYGMYYNDTRNEMYDLGYKVCRQSDIDEDIRQQDIYELPLKGEGAHCLCCGTDLDESSSVFCNCCDDSYNDYDDDYYY